MNSKARKIELLAPARDADTAIAAINHGADAVYIGPPAFGARVAAGNSIDDLARVVDYAHQFGVRIYVTFNTIIYDGELEQARSLVKQLYDIGVDALIVQDMGLLQMKIPPIELHASTQTDARTLRKIEVLSKAGFSQIVVPREFSLEQIRAASDVATPFGTAIEVFVHGALCVSYSGDCHAGAVLAGRSANRGECPQICRLLYRLTDGEGKSVRMPDKGSDTRHWLSLADMNRLNNLAELIEAGATSFKIEGRLKSVSYVKNVTAAYSLALDEIAARSNGRYERSSFGKVKLNFKPDPAASFNRGFTTYFLTGEKSASSGISSWNTPKWIGRPVARVVARKGMALVVESRERINNGDGMGYFDSKNRFVGFRVNKAEGNLLYPAPGSTLPERGGVQLYRNFDAMREALMAGNDTSLRTISVRMVLRRVPDGRIALEASDERGNNICVTTGETYVEAARSPQQGHRHSLLERLGDTIYRLAELEDCLGDIFMPSKALVALRRRAIECLDSAWRMRCIRHYRKPSSLSADALAGVTTSYHDNVANALAEDFYRRHGAAIKDRAIEVAPSKGRLRIMTTRYCLRRSLGACLKTKDALVLPSDLYLEAPVGRLKLEFDCRNCNMQIHYDN